MKKKWPLLSSSLVIVLVLSALLVACGGKETEETPTTEPAAVATATEIVAAATPEPVVETEKTTVRFVVSDLEQSLYQDLVTDFEAEHPDIEVKMVSQDEVLGIGLMDTQWPDDAWLRLASSADVINQQPSRSAIESGLVLDLNPMFDADPNTRPDDFLPGTLEECQWDGGAWCVPIHAQYQVIYFNKDAFDAAGEAYPEPGWTWDDFLEKAVALTERDGAEVTQWGFVLPWPQHVDLVDSWAGPLVNESTDPPQPLLDDPAVAEAVRWYTDLYLEYEVMPNYDVPDEVEATYVSEGQQLIDGGRAAMWPNSALLWDWLSQQSNIGVAPFPVDAPGAQGAGDMTTPMGIDAVSISAGTAQPEAAYRWATFLSQQSTELLGLKMVPARRSVIESGNFWEGTAPEYQDTMEFVIEHSYSRQWSSGYSAISEAITAVLNGEKSVEDALVDAQQQAEQDIAEALAAGDEATPAPTVVVAGEDEGEEEGVTTIVFTPGTSGLLNLTPFRDLASRFHESHPDISVELQQLNIYSGVAPSFPEIAADCDCFVWSPQLQSPGNLDAILSLEPFLDADTSFDIGDFFPVMVSRFEHQGQLWGLPSEASTYVIQYNKDIFDAAGVEYPNVSAGWTTDDFLAAASAVTSGEGDARIWGFLPNFYEVNDLIFMMERTGAELLDASQDPPSLDLTGASVQDALQWYVDLSNEYDVKPVYVGDISELLVATSGTVEREALIDSGNAAMWTAIGTLDILSTHEGLNLGVVPLPAPTSGSSGAYVSAEGYFISAQTEHRQECWQWITFLSEQVEGVTNIPARRSVAESEVFSNKVGEERAAAYLETMASADQPSSLQFLEDEAWMSYGLIWLGQAYSKTVHEEASIEEALAQVQDTFDQYRACVIDNDAFNDDIVQQDCVLEADPAFPAFLLGR